MIAATCHCGAVKVSIQAKPDYINMCDCSLCRKVGGAWGYFDPASVTVEGETATYRRGDYAEPAVEVRFCQKCGSTTHWVLTENQSGERMGVNMRLFQPEEIAGIEARTLDGHNWTGSAPAAHHRPPGLVGKDVFL